MVDFLSLESSVLSRKILSVNNREVRHAFLFILSSKRMIISIEATIGAFVQRFYHIFVHDLVVGPLSSSSLGVHGSNVILIDLIISLNVIISCVLLVIIVCAYIVD
jgi:hypothetical protein